MKRLVFLMVLAYALLSCERSDYPGFKRLEASVHYKLVALGDEERTIDPDQFVTIDVQAQSFEGNKLARKRMQRMEVGSATWPRHLTTLLQHASEGDSIVVIGTVLDLEANEWFRPINMGEDTSRIVLRVSVQEVLSAQEVLQVRAEERSRKDRELLELASLKKALDSLGFTQEDKRDGIYFRLLKRGNGKRARGGGELIVRYRAHLASGRKIDDTFQGDALHYIVGKPDQVLPGFGTALARMSEGAEALVVLPPDQAFGALGSSSGIVPPYAGLIYEVWLEEVRI